ncbi:MAG: hypothetical protein MRERV_42c003 [Mycoplasmataceae bacterium RV_VA103A]|nr:MAG: hypothetical protein MRERV_42c003 [Mycoplasmataceae bacterium RV_VA103A]
MLKKEINKENEWTKLKSRKKNITTEPPQEASTNLRQIELPYTRNYRPRLMKRTGRVVQFATRVTPEFDKWIRDIVQKENVYLAEVLERMMLVYQKEVHKYNFQYKNNKAEREREREQKSKKRSKK